MPAMLGGKNPLFLYYNTRLVKFLSLESVKHMRRHKIRLRIGDVEEKTEMTEVSHSHKYLDLWGCGREKRND